MSSILRTGRLAQTRKSVVKFISSIDYDTHIVHATILVNEAHILALVSAGVIEKRDAKKILKALRESERQIKPRENVEDIHVLIEEFVTKKTGAEIGGWMHLGKSRNDQVVTAIRITLREEILEMARLLVSLEDTLLGLARKHMGTVFPGYTHLQPAQPITFAHYLEALADAFLRDSLRIDQTYQRVNKSPMGAAAIAGTSFNLNRDLVARLLGFEGLVENSLDAVGTRDFAVETLGVCSIIALDISRVAQDLIFYSSNDVELIEIPDEFTSTSSIMPQKKNPDPLEIMRARCARVIGNYVSAATTLHALPSGFNLDFQEITPLIWSSIDTIKSCLKLLCELIPRIRVNKDIANRDSLRLIAATEIANVLVRAEGIPFRTAHHVVGRAVKTMLAGDVQQLTRQEWKRILGRDLKEQTFRRINETFNLRTVIRTYRTKGSPNPKQMALTIEKRKKQMRILSRKIDAYTRRSKRSILNLQNQVA
ncbi:MAG TPA: argininosuccinate lyase [Candidatus Bathyarchaeia archaeon]|nr:argininosuccinate lyase [Candidatus Bathyarchaeia archaeon]